MNGASKRIKITDLNPNLICVLCGGYFIDATTLTECLHSFCKKCIVKYLETSKQCPVCDVLVHKTRPHLHIRSDKTLQDLVYKLVPGLYKNEMKRRRDFYSKHPEVAPKKVGEERGDEMAERIIYTVDEHFSVALHFSKRGVRDERSVRSLTLPEVVAASKEPPKNVRYLRCPAGVTIGILKKFVRLKYELPGRYEIDIFHTDEALHDDYTLMDIAYIYTWRRRDPLRLNYSVMESRAKRPRHSIGPLADSFSLKLVKTEDTTLLKQENKSASAKQEGSKPTSKQVNGQEKKPTIKAEAVSKESKTTDKPGPRSLEQAEVCGQKSEDKQQVMSVEESTAATRTEVKMMVDQGTPAQPQAVAEMTHTAATTAALTHPSSQPLASVAEKATGRPAMSCAVKIKILQSSNHSSPSSSSAAKAKLAASAARPVSGKVGVTSQLAAGGKLPPEKAAPKTSSASGAVAASSKNVTGAKASDAMAAVGAAHTPEVRKSPQQQVLPPAASPGPLMTSSLSSSVPATSTTARSTLQIPSRQTNLVSSTSTTTAAVSTTGSSTSEKAPAQTAAAALVLSVSAGEAPAAADAGAAAACASSPAPAALAASSSPSPPMASTAASLKEPHEMHSCSTASSIPASSSAQSSVQTTIRASLPVVKLTVTPAPKNGRSGDARSGSSKATDAKNGLAAPKSVASEVASSSVTCPGKGAGGAFCKATTTSGTKTFGKKGEEASPAAAVSSSDDGMVDKDRQVTHVSAESGSGKKDSKVHASCPVASNSSKVAVGIPTFVSTSSDGAASMAGRVCNGMPPVVTRMLRVSNASTSVNTLPQKLHGKVGEQQQQQASPPQTARSLARNPPPPIQPATQTAGQPTPLPVTTHSLVRTSPGSAISLAVAKRQASELQALQQQQQQQQHHLQQQLLEQQRIQLIQHPFLSIHAAAAAARWNAADVLARVPAMTPQAASPTSAHANGLGVTMATAQSGSDGREAGGSAVASKKHEAAPAAAKQQKQGVYKKLAEATPSKKKISDIANTLHKKVSQSCAGSHKAAADSSPAADAKRPPNAHTASKAKAPEAGAAGQQAHAHGKASFPASSPSDREDEPLNLVTRDKDSQRHSRGASPRMQTSSSV